MMMRRVGCTTTSSTTTTGDQERQVGEASSATAHVALGHAVRLVAEASDLFPVMTYTGYREVSLIVLLLLRLVVWKKKHTHTHANSLAPGNNQFAVYNFGGEPFERDKS